MKNIQLHNCDNIELMKKLPDCSVDVACIDPPYLYLKNQKLERPFDEVLFFSECKRVLAKDGFIVLFGRGTSFYRWNTILADLGFTFKEEIIWDKSHNTSPLMAVSRVHEAVAIFTKGKGTINKVKVPYLEMKRHDLDSIITDIKRLKTILKNTTALHSVLKFLETNKQDYLDENISGKNLRGNCYSADRASIVVNSIVSGLNEKSIIRSDRVDQDKFTKFSTTADKRQKGDRCTDVIQSVFYGLNEKTIIKQVRDHYSAIHPTQKPVKLLIRLLKLVIPMKKEKIVIADFFAGSMSTIEAAIELQKEFPDKEFEAIGCEIDTEYFDLGQNRIKNITNQQIIF